MQSERTRPLHPEALPTDTQVGHWRVVERLGVGGYGAAYRVEDFHHPGVPLALKLALRPGDVRAEREVVLLMDKAVHPNVVRLHAHGRWPDPVAGHTYHVMDLVPGLPLDVHTETRNSSFLELARVGAKMALTLGELHARGVVHRDVKPENILIREPDGEPVLVDFGIGVYEGAAPLTPGPLPPGTPHLRSPEAMRFWLERGKHSGEPYEVGGADDLYALGVSLYRAATGHYPFKSEVLSDLLVLAIATQRVPVPRAVNRRMPRALSDVLMRMLAKDPKERYRDGAEVHDALMEAVTFGRRAKWEAGVFEWEEVPAVREGEAPGRRIRRPELPTRPVTPPAPAVRLVEGGGSSRRRRRGRTGAPSAVREHPKQSPARPWQRLAVALGVGLAVAAAYGLGAGPDEKPIPPVGHEMARAPEPPETGSAAAPLLPESTPAAVASRATSSEDEPPVKEKQQKSPTPPKSPKPAKTGTTTLRGLCAGAAAATNLACEEPWERELREAREENERLVLQLNRLQAEYQGQGSLTRLFSMGRMEMGKQGVVFSDLSKSTTPSPENTLEVEAVFAYRYTTAVPEGEEPVIRVAVALQLRNPEAQPWTAVSATLTRDGEEVEKPAVWQPEPIAPLGRGFVVTETELPEREAREKLTLGVRDEGGTRSVEIGNVSVP